MKRENNVKNRTSRGFKISRFTVFSAMFMMLLVVTLAGAAKQPDVGGDSNTWGTILNQYLNVSLTEIGTLKAGLNGSYERLNITDTLNASSINATSIQVQGNEVNHSLLALSQFNDDIGTGTLASTAEHIINITNFLGGTDINGSLIREGNLSTILVDGRIANDLTIQTTSELTVGGGFPNGVTLTTDGAGLFKDIFISGNLTLINEAEINGSSIPAVDATYLLGNGSNRWATGNFSGVLEASSIIASAGTASAHTLGTFGVGSVSSEMRIARDDLAASTTDYALKQTSTGQVHLNAPSGTNLVLALANVNKMLINSGGFDFADEIHMDDTEDSTSPLSGSIQTDGGLGVVKSVVIGENLLISGSLNATSINTTGNTYLAINSSNVGIGTTATDAALTLFGNMSINQTDGGAGGNIIFNGSHICIGSC
tara:strand:+ start:9880 stop:11163 length:1284 start_codon:yes stop_codon:yes gene_type:complete